MLIFSRICRRRPVASEPGTRVLYGVSDGFGKCGNYCAALMHNIELMGGLYHCARIDVGRIRCGRG